MSWVAVGTVAASVISGYMGNQAAKKAGKKSKDEKKMAAMLVEMAKNNNEFGQYLINMARAPLQQSVQFANQAASGDRETLMRLAGSDFKGIGEGAQQSLQTMSQLAPRTGASAEFMARVPYQVAQDQQRVLSGIKQEGRQTQMQLGSNLANMGANFLSNGQSGGMNMLGYERGRKQDAAAAGSATAGGTYQVLMGMLDAYNNRKKAGATNPTGGISDAQMNQGMQFSNLYGRG